MFRSVQAQITHFRDRLQVRSLVEIFHKVPTLSRELELEKKRESLLTRLNDFYSRAAGLFPSIRFDRIRGQGHQVQDVCTCKADCNCSVAEGARSQNDGEQAEHAIVLLPSSFATLPEGWDGLAHREESLRVAQANEALEAVRSDIGNKSYLYRANRSLATGKRERTRGYDAINGVERSMRINAQRYKIARWALHRLAKVDKYPQFQVLSSADTRAVTAIYDSNMPGLRTDDLSWIWKMNVQKDTEAHSRLEESTYIPRTVRCKARRLSQQSFASSSGQLDPFIQYPSAMGRRVDNLDFGDGVVCSLHALSEE
jgi:hypothetical protein